MTRMMMKMAAVSTITWLLFFCSVVVFTDAHGVCEYAEKGGNFTVPLLHQLDDSKRLKWKHKNIVILDRKNNMFIQGKKTQLSENGSLKLTNLTEEEEGEYQPEIFDKTGKGTTLNSTRLCLLDPLQKPTVKVECLQTNVKFTCSVEKAKNLKFEWLQNEKVLSAKNTQTFTLTDNAEKVQKDSFSCRVSNSISFQTSVAVKPCFKTKPFLPDTLLGINTWIIIGLGGGVVLVLIIIITVCCIRTRRKRSMQVKDEEELRLGWTNPEQQRHHHPHNHPPGQHHHQQLPAGHTGPRQHRSKQHREQQQRPKAPDLPNGHPQPSPRRPAQAPRPADNDDDEQPPPLPQPRKKAPKTPRV